MENHLETILNNKIKEFGDFLISICNDNTKKVLINKSIKDLSIDKILLFVMFLDTNKIDAQINDFIKQFSLTDNLENREKIDTYLKYFLNVSKILN